MGQPKAAVAYGSIAALMDKALFSENGLELQIKDRAKALSTRQYCYTVRRRAVEMSKKMYAPDHPEHGKSPYDELSFFITEDGNLHIGKGPDLSQFTIVDPVTREPLDL